MMAEEEKAGRIHIHRRRGCTHGGDKSEEKTYIDKKQKRQLPVRAERPGQG